ncbi:MAG: DUF1552 domain-containing protein [Deltaproteobacteria bacterium]|nr:DUF1552 domain-containing protein [Deltaproteobacteria bacterium]
MSFGRRTLVRRFGASLLASPAFTLMGLGAQAAEKPPRRLVVFATPNGTVMNSFWGPNADTLGPILSPLKAYQKRLLVMRGIDMLSAYEEPIPADHRPDFANALIAKQPFLTTAGFPIAADISIDQHIANTVGKSTRVASLQMGVDSEIGFGPINGVGPRRGIQPQNVTSAIYERTFGELAKSAGEASAMVGNRTRKSVLDVINKDLLAARCVVSKEERLKLDSHAEALRELERELSLDAAPVGACAAPPAPSANKVDFPTRGKMQMDLIASLLACDLTRVITLQWSTGQSQIAYPWAGVMGSHHAISHGTDGSSRDPVERDKLIVKIETWYAEQFAYLCGKLDAIKEADGTSVLDNTALLWIHEQSDGFSHSRKDMPYVLAGGCQGQFRVGRQLNLNGVPHNGLLISLAEAMGVPTPSFGLAKHSQGKIGSLHA